MPVMVQLCFHTFSFLPFRLPRHYCTLGWKDKLESVIDCILQYPGPSKSEYQWGGDRRTFLRILGLHLALLDKIIL